MLVLSRQRDETIMIGDEIEICVVDIRGDKVRLGITAPTRIAVHRKEVYEAIKCEAEQAAKFNSHIRNGNIDEIRRALSPGPQKTMTRKAGHHESPASPGRAICQLRGALSDLLPGTGIAGRFVQEASSS